MEFKLETKILRTFEIIEEPISKNTDKIKNSKNSKKDKIEKLNLNSDENNNQKEHDKKNNKLDIEKIKIKTDNTQNINISNKKNDINYQNSYDNRFKNLLKKINKQKKEIELEEYKKNVKDFYYENRPYINTLFKALINKYYNLGIKFSFTEKIIYDDFVEFLYEKTLY